VAAFLPADNYARLPSRYQKGIEQAVTLFRFLEAKQDVSFAPVFTPLLGPLDEAARGVLVGLLGNDVPDDRQAQADFFAPDLGNLPPGEAGFHERQGVNLRRTLVDRNGLMPIGLLRWALDYARHSRRSVGGVFQAVRQRFSEVAQTDLYELIDRVYSFRNEYIAHQERELSEPAIARQALGEWARGLHRVWSLCLE
jgi:type III restriction enzyme